MIDDPVKMVHFPFYFWDFERDTMHMEDSQKMAYLRLLAFMYLHGGHLPDDEKTLARMSGYSIKQWRRMYRDQETRAKYGTRCPHLMLDMMSHTSEGWTQKKVLEQVEHFQALRDKSRAGAAARWGDNEAESCSDASCLTDANQEPGTMDQPIRLNGFDLDPTGEERGSRASAPPRPPPSDDCVEEIFELLRRKTGRKFQTKRTDGKPTTGALLVRRRLSEGNQVDDMRAMVAMKCNEWLATPMEMNLKPGTLFGEKNFDDYMGLLFGGSDDGE